MSLTAAASGFLLFLLSVQVVQGQSDREWGGTYTPSAQICALKGTTVTLHCTYRYPSRGNNGDTTVEKTFWFTNLQDKEPVDLRTDPKYAGRVEYRCGEKTCSLTIRDLRESDSATYKFRFITNQPGGRASGEPGVTLSVTGLQVQKSRLESCFGACTWADLKCHSSCRLTSHPSYIWYKNGEIMKEKDESFRHFFYPKDSYSCAVRGNEALPSPSVCVLDQTCNKVTYADRRVCAFKGSSVDISCTYNINDDDDVESKFWFSPERSRRWRYNDQPEDLSEDSQYERRVHIVTRGGRSTLRITDLRYNDAAEYRFKFKTQSFEWRSILPGTTLTVTEPDLQVQVIWSSTGPTLICHSSCLTDRSAFVWYKNETKIEEETTPSYRGNVDPADNYSCAYQSYRSPPVYAPKVPSVSVVAPVDIMKGDSVTLSCSSDANPAAKYTWYKENQTLHNNEPQLVFSPIQLSNSGEYHCTAENELGRKTSESVFINVNYAPKISSVSVSPSGEIVEGSSVTLSCSSDANPAAKYTWYKKNQTLLQGAEGSYHFTSISSEDRGIYHCKSENQFGRIISSSIFIDVQYAPKLLSVSVSPSAEIVEGSSVTLSCSSDANPAAKYTWYKKNQTLLQGAEGSYHFTSISSEDRGIYYCKSENQYGRIISSPLSVDVQYAPKLPSVSVSPSAEIVEGSSVTLSCSSDANPAAKYTWYKKNQTLLQGAEGSYHFTSISSEDRGIYHCKSENKYGRIISSPLSVDVQYAPKLPSVSVSPSAEIVEGSSVTLSCSSDANPAANFTWYKKNEDSPKASGQIFSITDFRAEHSGSYFCVAENRRGRRINTLRLTVAAHKSMRIMNITRLTLVVVVLIPLLLVCLLMRKKKVLSCTKTNEPTEAVELESDPDYVDISDVNAVTAAQTEDTEEQEDLV